MGLLVHFFFDMGHYEQERELQREIELAVAGSDANARAVDVLDVELDAPRNVVRVFIDAPGGVDHGLCAAVTHALPELRERYAVEVSSPGLDRPLRRPEHFAAVTGRAIRVRRRGGKRAFNAVVVEAGSEELLVRRSDGSEDRISYQDMARSHLIADEPMRSAQGGQA